MMPLTDSEKVAGAFVLRLERALGGETLAAIRAENAKRRAAGDRASCASHDYCDSNVYMMRAFRSVVGRYPRTTGTRGDSDLSTMNEAWRIALP